MTVASEVPTCSSGNRHQDSFSSHLFLSLFYIWCPASRWRWKTSPWTLSRMPTRLSPKWFSQTWWCSLCKFPLQTRRESSSVRSQVKKNENAELWGGLKYVADKWHEVCLNSVWLSCCWIMEYISTKHEPARRLAELLHVWKRHWRGKSTCIKQEIL